MRWGGGRERGGGGRVGEGSIDKCNKPLPLPHLLLQWVWWYVEQIPNEQENPFNNDDIIILSLPPVLKENKHPSYLTPPPHGKPSPSRIIGPTHFYTY